jgi:hypothetical protein
MDDQRGGQGGGMYLAITIDVEEDNWSSYDTSPVLSNIPKLSDLQKTFDSYEVKPTYLITYPVASDRNSVSLLRKILEDGGCEIGAHLHPWNTPPFEEEKTVENTMLCNLEKDLQYRKMESLHEKITENFGMEPAAFRSGRWGFGPTVAENMYKLGYKVDSSVSPYLNWEKCHGPDFSDRSPMPQFLYMDQGKYPGAAILEVPATIGFLQEDFELCNSIYQKLSNSKLKHFRLRGILDRLNLLNKVWLSPEPDNAESMIRLAETMKKKNCRILNMFFHSPSLRHGLTHFTRTREEAAEMFRRIETFLEFAKASKTESITLSESLRIITQPA